MVILTAYVTLFAQSNVWIPVLPEFDSSMVKEEHYDDTSFFSIQNETSIFEIKKNRTLLSYSKFQDSAYFSQQLEYLLTDYNRKEMKHVLNVSGKYTKKKHIFSGMNIGLDWNPDIYMHRRDSVLSLEVPVDFGPVVSTELFKIPVLVRGGISALGYNNNLKKSDQALNGGSYHGDPGYYGGCMLGDTLSPLFSLPIFARFSFYGKSIGNKGLAIATSSVKAGFDLGSGDSVFALVGDSLSNGKELSTSSLAQSKYTNAYWIIKHKFSASGAIRGKERLFTRPAVIYNYFVNTIRYPSQQELLSDVKTSGNAVTLQLSSDINSRIMYDGGLTYGVSDINYLYNRDVSRIQNSSNTMLLNAKYASYKEVLAISDHDLLLQLSPMLTFNYQLHATSTSRRYPFIWLDSARVEHKNPNESDLVRVLHHGGLIFEKDSSVTTEIYGEYAKNYHYFYRKSMSGTSTIRDDYKIGLDMNFKIGPLRIIENAYVIAQKSDFKFVSVHRGDNFDPPPYSRIFSSLLIINWNIFERLAITGKWNEMYYDDGRWYGQAYSDSAREITTEFYGIERKSLLYTISLGAEYYLNNAVIGGGLVIRDENVRNFNPESGEYLINEEDEKGYYLQPSIQTRASFKNIIFNFKIGREFRVIYRKGPITMDNYSVNFDTWDISLKLKAEF
jgi:hypothetical protein